MRPNKREIKKVIDLLDIVKEKITKLGFFPGWFEEGFLDVDYCVNSAAYRLRKSMDNSPIYLPLKPLFDPPPESPWDDYDMWEEFELLSELEFWDD